MSSDLFHQDPTFPAMTMDILDNMLSHSDNPGELANYLTEEIRELTGARCVLLFECLHDSHRLMAVNPERRRNWAELPESQLLYEASHELTETQLWETDDSSTVSSLLSGMGFDISIAAPLQAQDERIGGILLLGLPDKLHIQSEIDLLTRLSKVFALMLRNAILYRDQEQTIEERTKELRLHSITIDNMKDAVFWINPDSSFRQINKSACKMLGYSAEEFSHFSLMDICPQLTTADWQPTWLNLRKDGAIESEMIFRHKTGKDIPVDISATYFEFDGDAYNCTIARDITERKRAEENQRASKAFLENILNTIGDPIFVKDDQHRLIIVNDAFCTMFGLPRSEAIGKTLAEHVPPDEQDHFMRIDRQVIEDGKENAIEETLTLKDSKVLTILTKKTRYVAENGDRFLVGVIRDITERKGAEEERIKLENRLQQSHKMESIGTLAGGIAHDFNNILAAILGYAEMAKDASQHGSIISNDLEEVLEAGKRAKSLVRRILTFSRQDDVERIHLQPGRIVYETIKMLRPSLPTTIEITENIDVVTGLVFVDPTQLNQVLMNLCTNAFHAMEETGGKLDISLKEVTLTSEDLIHEPDIVDGTFIQFSVSDSGPGISSSIQKKVFDPYFTTKKVGKGTGMGLATVHGIVKSYGGFISLYSELGEGTVFHVFLPVEKKGTFEENEIDEQILIGKERILFVDDEEILATMGKKMLERLGYRVTVKNNSLEALDTFQKQPDQFDLIITDQTMPSMTGSEMSRQILQIRPDIPIILCTGYSTIISEEKAKFMGIKEFALKPLTKKDMAKLIRKVLDVS